MNMPNYKERLGASFISRDSSTTIRRAIESLKPYCNQIVVVDTGSIDNSPNIASLLGADVFFLKWNNNFAEARNYALSLMRTDWIISLDTDEELDSKSLERNSGLFLNNDIGGISVIIDNFLNENDISQKSTHRYTRIFRRHPLIRYEGSIHEQIAETITGNGLQIAESDILIHHYGYLNTSESKKSRNKELLEQELSQNQSDVWLKYHLGETEFSMNNFPRAEELFSAIYQSQQLSVEQREKAAIRLSQIKLKKGDSRAVLALLNFKCSNSDNEGLKLFIQAAAYLDMKDFDSAYKLYNMPELISSNLVDKSIVKKAIDALNRIFNER
ncbi:MAG: glycosyl transferase family 2 [Ignavibacteria bacterium]|nr:glycosyl transferase family 2 [Ignavibacteria bacterium]